MRYLKNSFNIKIALSFMALIIGVCLFLLNRSLINHIREETNFRAEQSAEILTHILNENEILDNVLLEQYSKFIESLNFPIIISNEQNECIVHKVKILEKNDSSVNCKNLKNIIKDMDNKNKPIPIIYKNNQAQLLHFGDPFILTEIINLSFITIGFFVLFIIIFLWGFYFMKSNEKDLIYAGMAKEAAHQLGTPLSSIFGWIELLKEEKNQTDILMSLKKDASRISEVTDRFSKIGSNIKLVEIDLIQLLKEVKIYFEKRVSKKYKIKLTLNKNRKIKINGDKILIFWAFENIIKNAIDAIEKNNGKIFININKNKNNIIIDFIDNGKGINRRNKRNIFKPGYSTKTRGWGLGLSLTKRIVENIHRGYFLLQSSKPGKTIFRIKF